MTIDEAFAELYKALKNDEIEFQDFRTVGVIEYATEYYSAGNNIVVIRNRDTGSINIYKALGPAFAMDKYRGLR